MPVPYRRKMPARAVAFLRQPANVGVSPVDRESVDPLGEGRTRAVPAGMFTRDEGDREYPPPSNSRVVLANSASRDRA